MCVLYTFSVNRAVKEGGTLLDEAVVVEGRRRFSFILEYHTGLLTR